VRRDVALTPALADGGALDLMPRFLTGAAGKGAEGTGVDADVGGLYVEVAVEERLVAMLAHPHLVCQRPQKRQVVALEQCQGIFVGKALACTHFVTYGVLCGGEAAICQIERSGHG
jgi:hypothetical protein